MTGESARECLEACHACADACHRCAAACLHEDNVRAMARCIALDLDCAATCALTAGALARGSELIGAIASLCAEACEACGAECGRHDHDHCRACADACRRCAEACRKMSVSG